MRHCSTLEHYRQAAHLWNTELEIAISPKAKEIMIASTQQNCGLRFYFPEMFVWLPQNEWGSTLKF